ncbi:MAG: hypothetical protein K2W95_07685 [Candidatus Obscuribacterales bacterium]|nr:hypothetical protein [Candidatus Obscuribacterales bacterium]
MRKQFLALACLLSIQQCSFASEEGDWLKSLDEADSASPTRLAARSSAHSADGDSTVTDAELHGLTAATLRTRAEHALKVGNYKTANRLLERALELAPSDNDARLLYAQSLKMQIDKTHSKDPVLFNQCVKQYFSVFKNSDFLEDSKVAERHLEELTGHRPRLFSKPAGYLRSVLKPEDTSTESVAAEVLEPQQVP